MTTSLFFYTLDIDSVDSEQVYKQINNNYDTLSVLSFQNNIDNIKEKIEIKNQHFSNKIEIIEERENQLTNKIINDNYGLNNINNNLDNKNDKTKKHSKILQLNEKSKQVNHLKRFICIKRIIRKRIYRKDAYIKHFKAIFAKYLKNKLNSLKDICFPYFSLNKFSTPNYRFTGNPKIKDNFIFLSWKIKDILIYGENQKNINRQYNNKLIIKYIENNENKSKDKIIYKQMMDCLNNKLEDAFIEFYNDKNESKRLQNDNLCIFYDKYFKEETGFSLIEKNGLLKIIFNKNQK